ncbi:MAG: sarcosine oxidase subunit gamma [Alphaproteobacteria bacterium]|nr:sarcosine oxidase subunit gamma [Alphaproteobacteria bacterium]MCB9928158.1 sarcosine oxidase subunit gamma [Alphaproteobacteria bacterium]
MAELFLAAQSAPPDDTARVFVQSVPLVGQVAVRGRPEDGAFRAAVRAATGLDLPLAVGGVAEAGDYRALWLGPDHWLVVTAAGEGPALVARLQPAFAGLFAAAVDVSGARTRLRLIGPAAADVLASGCRLDLGPDAFGAGQAVQAPVGNVTAIVHCLTAEPPGERLCYDLYVPRSQALSFWRWLEQAGRPWGLGVRA